MAESFLSEVCHPYLKFNNDVMTHSFYIKFKECHNDKFKDIIDLSFRKSSLKFL